MFGRKRWTYSHLFHTFYTQFFLFPCRKILQSQCLREVARVLSGVESCPGRKLRRSYSFIKENGELLENFSKTTIGKSSGHQNKRPADTHYMPLIICKCSDYWSSAHIPACSCCAVPGSLQTYDTRNSPHQPQKRNSRVFRNSALHQWKRYLA